MAVVHGRCCSQSVGVTDAEDIICFRVVCCFGVAGMGVVGWGLWFLRLVNICLVSLMQ